MQITETYKIKNTRKHILLLVFIFNILLLHAQKKYVVVLDAGHGGKDPGKVGHNNYKEKEIALDITLQVGKILSKNENITVKYTRTTDTFVDLWKRGSIANKAHADLFVSIHCNAHSSQAKGSETWVLGLHANEKNFEVAKRENSVILLEDDFHEKYKGFDPNSPESVIGLTLLQENNLDKSLLLASTIQEHFSSKLKRVDRGVKQAGFVVLHQTTMPSVLIETGFLTNKAEGKYLNSKKGKEEVSKSIAASIEKYINQQKVNTVAVYTEASSSSSSESAELNANIIYKVQIASSTNKLATKSYNFKGLKDVERVQVGKYYKYYYGQTPDYNTVKEALKTAKGKGYKSAWVVAFKNGESISVTEALKMQ